MFAEKNYTNMICKLIYYLIYVGIIV